ncbi:hypothetical protein JR316_0000582 [Psilocybe cubensis]|uniref:Uncharacterized protein n=2 Tax=Psilocybe cubensis TaxID=181762 RepID=A0A8H7Y9S3_PSICU|nr:hypothetical protein JR316_0000582 [Psilocybe cubensis]KAH9486517.1 hypothetical protein JR316_0000582 [Psilocybe cubensis]
MSGSTNKGTIFNVPEVTGKDQIALETTAAEARLNAPNAAVAREVEHNAEGVKEAAQQAAAHAKAVGRSLTGEASTAAGQFRGDASRTTDAAVEEGKQDVENVKAATVGYVEQAKSYASSALETAQAYLPTAIGGKVPVVDNATNAASNAAASVQNTAANAGNAARSGASNAATTTSNAASNAATTAQNNASSAYNTVVDTVQPVASNVAATVEPVVAGVAATLQPVAASVASGVQTGAAAAYNVAKENAPTVASHLQSGAATVLGTAHDLIAPAEGQNAPSHTAGHDSKGTASQGGVPGVTTAPLESGKSIVDTPYQKTEVSPSKKDVHASTANVSTPPHLN